MPRKTEEYLALAPVSYTHLLVISEKPSVAMAYANVLGATNRKDGYLEGNGYLVS